MHWFHNSHRATFFRRPGLSPTAAPCPELISVIKPWKTSNTRATTRAQATASRYCNAYLAASALYDIPALHVGFTCTNQARDVSPRSYNRDCQEASCQCSGCQLPHCTLPRWDGPAPQALRRVDEWKHQSRLVSGFTFFELLWQLARLRSDEDEGSAFGGSLHAVVASSSRALAASMHQVFGFAHEEWI